jgi:hypothetical protein
MMHIENWRTPYHLHLAGFRHDEYLNTVVNVSLQNCNLTAVFCVSPSVDQPVALFSISGVAIT